MRTEQIGDCQLIGFVKLAYVYGIAENASSEVLYVGTTINPIKHRIRGHIRTAMRDASLPVHKWMKERNCRFTVVCLDIVDEADRESAEKRHIATLKPRLNLTIGGAGLSGYYFAGTDHAKKIAAKLKTGSTFQCIRCGTSFWRKQKDIIRSHNKYCSRVCSNRRHHEAA